MLLYEGRRETLTLKAKNLEKNLFLSRVFRKHARKLHIHINCTEDQLNKFLTFVLPQFLDANKLEEVVFIGPIYLQQNPIVPFAKLKRIITESLVFKHSHFMQKLAFLGCEMTSFKDDKDRFVHKQVEYYSKPLSFECVTSPADSVLSRCNIDLMMYSTLKHIVFEYELISTEALETLSQLSNLSLVTLNVIFKRQMVFPAVDWRRVNSSFGKQLSVAVNIISMPQKKFKAVMDSVFVEGMSLTSLKVLFCKTLYVPLLSRVCCMYKTSLRELVWADSPHDGVESARYIRSRPDQVFVSEAHNQVNPFIYLCWTCRNLRRLAIHGYWIWEYDLVGFARLQKSLQLEVSSLYEHEDRFGARAGDAQCALRVMQYDAPATLDMYYIQNVNECLDYVWRPYPWRRLHPALRARSSPENRADYIVKEVLKPLGVT